MNCRFCKTHLAQIFIDLVASPPSNSFLTRQQLNEPEVYYPLELFVCMKCFLVQIDEYKKYDDIFNSDYVYFSSYSSTWVEHAKQYVEMITPKLSLDKESFVIEIASNDGYLLQYFKEKSIACLGVEPTENTAQVARQKGIETIIDFFGEKLAKQIVGQRKKADLIIGNNVFAHTPDINDFVRGLKAALSPDGVITLEFPYLLQLMKKNQFDTIYHEHFSYFSFYAANRILSEHGLIIYDVEELQTHGGSLRIYACHRGNDAIKIKDSVGRLLQKENYVGVLTSEFYSDFQKKADRVKYDLINFLIDQKNAGKRVVAYGAAAKGNTILNYCGIKKDLVSFVVDASPHKQGKFLPGSHIPVVTEKKIKEFKPHYVLILPWNIKEEISRQLSYIKQWQGEFVVAVPELKSWAAE